MGPRTMSPNRVMTAASCCQHAIRDRATTSNHSPVQAPPQPLPSATRLASTDEDQPYDVQKFVKEGRGKDETVLYLAYGSNLSNEKFRGDRGIKPLAQINVQVPKLRMTFDLPGLPYAEPCFANSARRDPDHESVDGGEKTPLLDSSNEGRKEKEWHKGLIGVVYEVTAEDYAHIIATEGGGASYKDITVDCYPLPTGSPRDPIPRTPETKPFKAHTLFAPAASEGDEPSKGGGHLQRPHPDYAQASARYLKLITDGAAECNLPYEYQDYLQSLHPFTITRVGQRIGQFLFLSIWGPIVLALFALSKMVANEDGTVPSWMAAMLSAVFTAVWASYDGFFKPIFGEGERTIAKDEKEGRGKTRRGRSMWRKRSDVNVDVEKAAVRTPEL